MCRISYIHYFCILNLAFDDDTQTRMKTRELTLREKQTIWMLKENNGAFPLHGMARYGSILGGFPLGTVPGTWYFFSTTSAGVPSDPYRYQTVMCKLCWSLIGRRESSLLRHWTCDMRPNRYPLDLNQHSQRRIGRNFCLNKPTF